MANNKIINFQILVHIIDRLTWIWIEQDSVFCDGRKIHNWERTIENRFKELQADEQMKEDIRNTFCILDRTYKEQNDRLRALGYTIINV